MTDAPGGDATASTNEPPRRASRTALVGTLVLALVLGIGAGALIGTKRASGAEQRAQDARDAASEQEDAARDRRELLDVRLELIEAQAKPLAKPVTDGALVAGSESTTQRTFGEEFSVDGATYTVYGVEFVDSFESKVEDRPATEEDGMRWALVDVDVRNELGEQIAPVCGTIMSVRLIDTSGEGHEEPDFEPPIHEDSYDTCGNNLDRGEGGRWRVPIRVSSDLAFSGVHVADVYARSSDSTFKVVRGTAAWIPFEEDVKPGATGDDPVTVGPGRKDEE